MKDGDKMEEDKTKKPWNNNLLGSWTKKDRGLKVKTEWQNEIRRRKWTEKYRNTEKEKHIGVKTETMKKEEKKKGSNKEFGNK